MTIRSLLLGVAFSAVVSVAAHAQPPQSIVGEDVISLGEMQTRTFSFDSAVSEIHLAESGIVDVKVQSDHVISLTALRRGEVLAQAYSPAGKLVASLRVEVGGSDHHVVKMYGPGYGDYTTFYCSSTGCGRSDPDVQETAPSSQSVSVTRQARDGSAVTRTKNYNH